MWIKNIYQSTGLVPKTLSEDIEAENFYLYDKNTKNIRDTIKVYPRLNQAVVGIDREHRNSSGDLNPLDFAMSKHFPKLWGMLYLLYVREFEVLYEHDKVSIFGLVTYDTVNDQLCFEKVNAMFQGSKQGLIDLLNN